MFWTFEEYVEIVVGEYHYKLVGWPRDTRFANLSDVRGGEMTMAYLLRLWKTKKMRFVALTDDEHRLLATDPEYFKPAPDCAHSKRRTPRADTGKRRKARRNPKGTVLGGPKTPVEVPESDEDPILDADDLLPGGCAYVPSSV